MTKKFKVHSKDSAPKDSQSGLQDAEKANGFVPNLYGVMAESPQLLKAYMTLSELAQASSFNADQLTVVWQTINVENNCHYCVPAHSAIAKSMEVDDELNQAVINGKVLKDDTLEALRRFTLSIVMKNGQVSENDLKAFYDAGYAQQQVLEVVLLVGQKTLSNYTNYLAKTPLDPAFKKFK